MKTIYESAGPAARYVWVRYGRNGSQLARVLVSNDDRAFRVQKFRKNSNRWTNPVSIVASEVIGECSREDAETLLAKTRTAFIKAAVSYTRDKLARWEGRAK